MRAELVDQPDLAFAVAEAHQMLAHQLHTHRRAIRLRNFGRQQEWRPIPAQQFAHEGSLANAAKLIVLLTRHHGDVSSSVCYASCSFCTHSNQPDPIRKTLTKP